MWQAKHASDVKVYRDRLARAEAAAVHEQLETEERMLALLTHKARSLVDGPGAPGAVHAAGDGSCSSSTSGSDTSSFLLPSLEELQRELVRTQAEIGALGRRHRDLDVLQSSDGAAFAAMESGPQLGGCGVVGATSSAPRVDVATRSEPASEVTAASDTAATAPAQPQPVAKAIARGSGGSASRSGGATSAATVSSSHTGTGGAAALPRKPHVPSHVVPAARPGAHGGHRADKLAAVADGHAAHNADGVNTNKQVREEDDGSDVEEDQESDVQDEEEVEDGGSDVESEVSEDTDSDEEFQIDSSADDDDDEYEPFRRRTVRRGGKVTTSGGSLPSLRYSGTSSSASPSTSTAPTGNKSKSKKATQRSRRMTPGDGEDAAEVDDDDDYDDDDDSDSEPVALSCKCKGMCKRSCACKDGGAKCGPGCGCSKSKCANRDVVAAAVELSGPAVAATVSADAVHDGGAGGDTVGEGNPFEFDGDGDDCAVSMGGHALATTTAAAIAVAPAKKKGLVMIQDGNGGGGRVAAGSGAGAGSTTDDAVKKVRKLFNPSAPIKVQLHDQL